MILRDLNQKNLQLANLNDMIIINPKKKKKKVCIQKKKNLFRLTPKRFIEFFDAITIFIKFFDAITTFYKMIFVGKMIFTLIFWLSNKFFRIFNFAHD